MTPKPKTPATMTETDAVQALAALAQDTRLRLFRALVVAGPAGLTPGQMAQAQSVPPTALSFHLKALCSAGLVSSERDGRHIIYRAAFPAMDELLRFLTAECCQGKPCLEVSLPVCVNC